MKIVSVKEKDFILHAHIKTGKKETQIIYDIIKKNCVKKIDSIDDFIKDTSLDDDIKKSLAEKVINLKSLAIGFLFNSKKYQKYVDNIKDFKCWECETYLNYDEMTIDFNLVYPLYPIIDLVDIKQLANDSTFNPLLEKLNHTVLNNFAKYNYLKTECEYQESKNSEACFKDKLVIDYQAFIDNQPIKSLSKKNYEFILGESDLLFHFDFNLLGCTKNEELVFNVSFPKWYYDEKLAKKIITFKVKVKKIYEYLVPPKFDEFYERVIDLNSDEIFKKMWNDKFKRFCFFLTFESKRHIPKDFLVEDVTLYEKVDFLDNLNKKNKKVESKSQTLETLIDKEYLDIMVFNYMKKYNFKFNDETFNKKTIDFINNHEDLNSMNPNSLDAFMNIRKDLILEASLEKLYDMLFNKKS